MKMFYRRFACVGLLAFASPSSAASPDIPGVQPAPAEVAKTEDRQATQETILGSFRNDENLSEDARKADVTVDSNGIVTLRGPVRTQEEKAKIEANAIRVAGSGRVVNHLEVTNSPQDTHTMPK